MKYDYAIIGAGAAGLAAARTLSGAGKRICILEARDRIGGRIQTLHPPDLPVPIELGAEFVHGEPPSTLSIVEAAALSMCELPDTHWWSRNGRWMLDGNFWEQLKRVLGKPPKRDMSFDELLRTKRNLSPRIREMARQFAEGFNAAHADRISAATIQLGDPEDSTPHRQFRLAGGQDALLAWLRAGLDPERADVFLGTAVKVVQWSQRSVTIECANGERIHAAALIVTIPIGVWKAPVDAEGAIRFDPPLKEKRNALAKIEAGHVVKIAFRFRERFWNDDRFIEERATTKHWDRGAPINFVHSSHPFMPTWWTTAPIRSPILIGWAGGYAAEALMAEGDAMIDRALDALAKAWCVPRKRIDALLAGTYTYDWRGDPYSRCAYSYAGVGGQRAHAALAKPIAQTLFFAGEATSGDQTGTVAGAIDSGDRAAKQALHRR